MKTRIIHTKIWDDEWFQDLDNDSKILFLYVLTCQDINISGIFELSDRKITYHTGLSGSILSNAKKSLSEKILFSDSWVWVKNVDRFNSYKGIKNDSARVNELLKVPKNIMDNVRDMDTSMDTSIYTALNTNTNLNQNQNTVEPKVTQEFLEGIKKEIADKLKVKIK